VKPEKKIENAGNDHADYKGIEHCKMSVPGRVGWPDQQYFVNEGYSFFIEYKAPGEPPKETQVKVHKRLRKRGFQVYVVDNIEMAVAIIDQEIEKCKRIYEMTNELMNGIDKGTSKK